MKHQFFKNLNNSENQCMVLQNNAWIRDTFKVQGRAIDVNVAIE